MTSLSVTGRTVVAVIGGGFSGAAVALHLARSGAPVDVVIIDPADRIGRGVAYGSSAEHLLLNVPAGKLTIDPQRPGDFLAWCRAAGRSADSHRFLPRAWFGDYVESSLAAAFAASGSARLVKLRDRAASVALSADGPVVVTTSGERVRAAHVVLALGNGPTRVPEPLMHLRGSDHLLVSPWHEPAKRRLAAHSRDVILLGSGLTMCDAAITLARYGFRGRVTVVSRRSLLPQAHGPSDPSAHAAWAASLGGESLTRLARSIRQRARTHAHDWRSVMDAMRPHTQRLWRSLSPRDRCRFVARLAVYWDVHRHRAPQEVDAAVHILRGADRLGLRRGTVERAVARDGRLACDVRHRRGRLLITADAIILCSGPESDPGRWQDPLFNNLFGQGFAERHPTGMGIRSAEDGRAVGAGGAVTPWLWTLGALRRGDLWESTAVPEIAPQAAVLAQRLLTGGEGVNARDMLSIEGVPAA